METKHVIAYVMHETERDLAAQLVENAEVTDSYVIGDIDDKPHRGTQAGRFGRRRGAAGRPAHDRGHGTGHMSAEGRPGVTGQRRWHPRAGARRGPRGRLWDLWLSDASVWTEVMSWLEQHGVSVGVTAADVSGCSCLMTLT
jgi:hypothetical protein